MRYFNRYSNQVFYILRKYTIKKKYTIIFYNILQIVVENAIIIGFKYLKRLDDVVTFIIIFNLYASFIKY